MGGAGVVMADETKEEIAMAECGACRAIVPLNSDNCPECNISFSGVSDESLGECGACQGLVPLDSTKCSHCGTIFVADDVVDVLRKWLAETGISIPILFKKFDKDGDGLIDSAELKSGLLSLKLADLPPSQVDRLIKTIDEDGDGQIDLGELHETITGEAYSAVASEDATVSETVEDDTSEDDSEVEEEPEEDEDTSNEEPENDEEEISESVEVDEDDEESGNEEETADEDEEDPDEVEETADEGDESEDTDLDDMDDVLDEIEDELDEDYEMEDYQVAEPLSLLHLISEAMDDSGDSPTKFFNSLDKDGDGNVSVEEFTNAIEGLIETEVTSKDIESFLVNADDDGDGAIDIIEFVSALESLEDADEAVDDDSRLSKKIEKPFPTDMQRKMMGKQWNDIVWPLIHLAFGLFIAAWLINGLGGIGPLGVDGSGGNIALETDYKIGFGDYEEGDIYPCDSSVQVGECKNSLTPFAGEASSMPAGFYWDGIFLMVLGALGMVASLATHLAIVPGWRARAKAMKEVEEDTDEARSGESDEELEAVSNEELDEDSGEDDSESELEDEIDDDSVEESDDEDDVEEDEGDGTDDEIDIGSHVGLSLGDEEVFGVIIEFDDEEETVTIKEDGTGDLVTGYQEDMFVE